MAKLRLMRLTLTRNNAANTGMMTVIAAALLMMAVMLQGMIPAGFMPELNGSQPFKMVICTIDGAQTVQVKDGFNPDGGKSRHPVQGHDTKQPCAFSVLHHSPVKIPAPVIAFASYQAVVVQEFSIRHDTPSFPILLSSAQPRGPPAIV